MLNRDMVNMVNNTTKHQHVSIIMVIGQQYLMAYNELV